MIRLQGTNPSPDRRSERCARAPRTGNPHSLEGLLELHNTHQKTDLERPNRAAGVIRLGSRRQCRMAFSEILILSGSRFLAAIPLPVRVRAW